MDGGDLESVYHQEARYLALVFEAYINEAEAVWMRGCRNQAFRKRRRQYGRGDAVSREKVKNWSGCGMDEGVP